MNSLISFPGKIANIGHEIDHHGNAVTHEVRVMHGIIDSHGKGIEDEMRMMRESFENEMKNMQKTTKKICVTVLAVNVLTRIFIK